MSQDEFKYAFDQHKMFILNIKDTATLKLNNWYSFCLLSKFIYNAIKTSR